jgi:uncharacterized protein (TIGR02996 family)
VTQEDVFLQEILANPDDDAPRLVFADWLDDQGDAAGRERAEFIRVQCRVARLDPEDDGDEAEQTRRREGYLLWHQQQAWLTAFKLREAELRLERGFVAGMRLAASNWLRCARRVRAATPLRGVTLWGVKESPKVLTSPTLAGVARLDLSACELGDERIGELASSKHLAGLADLRLTGNGIGPGGALALARSPHLAGLTFLDLSNNTLGDEGAQMLASSPHWTSLRELHLTSNGIGDDGARALASWPALASLHELVIQNNEITPDGARALTGSAHLKNLKMLYLNHNRLSGPTRKSLAKKWGERISCDPGR